MIQGLVRLGATGPEILRGGHDEKSASGTPAKRGVAALILSPQLYQSADEECPWTSETSAVRVARVGRKRYVTSERVCETVQMLVSQPVKLIPAAAFFREDPTPEQAQSLWMAPGTGDQHEAKLSSLRPKHPRRRQHFRRTPDRASRFLVPLLFVLIVAATFGLVRTQRFLAASRDARARAEAAERMAERAFAASDGLQWEAATLEETIRDLERPVSAPPVSLIGAIVAALPDSLIIERFAFENGTFALKVHGESVDQVIEPLGSLALVVDLTLESRREPGGAVTGQIRGRFGK